MIGERLTKLRKSRQLSQEQLGKILHVSQGAVSTYETNDREAPDSIKIKAAQYFGVTVDYLLGVSDKQNPL